ncbi:MAG: hypothetical protein IT245_02305 [Bacteroidia bacterium]|nr:hypothetical protein [Bacteroidia bacterium]
MLSKIEHLSSSEKQLVMNAPVLISALVAGADGEFAPEEIAQAIKIIHVKTYSETRDVSGVYKALDGHTEDAIDQILEVLPSSTLERTQYLSDTLIGLNDIFPKLEPKFANDLYTSLRELAYYVSNAGDLGIGMRSEQEKELAKLSFLHVPSAE